MANLELSRGLLESLEVIEESVSRRFQRNPKLYYSYRDKLTIVTRDDRIKCAKEAKENYICKVKKRERSKKQVLLQQHEVNTLWSDVRKKKDQMDELQNNIEIKMARSFEEFENHLIQINAKYSDDDATVSSVNQEINKYYMFSSSNGKQDNILSNRCKYLNINKYFSKEEQYGEVLELEQFYNDWLSVIRTADYSLTQFLTMFELFKHDSAYILNPPMDRKNERYSHFLHKIGKYLTKFLRNSYVLIDWLSVEKDLKIELNELIKKPIKHEKKGLFCRVCGKYFKTIGVFNGHATGKNHLNCKEKRSNLLLAEFRLHKQLSWLEKIFENTKNYVEQKSAFTSDERQHELKKLQDYYEEPAYRPEESEDDTMLAKDNTEKYNQDTVTASDMPLGPDGLPMPFWLYKLQGLDVVYTCEICSNTKFSGRKAYEKHFYQATHKNYLRCLGIKPSSAFNGITKITDAQQLWESILQSKSNQIHTTSKGDDVLQEEVEDKDGNVLPKNLYEELKKQGLV